MGLKRNNAKRNIEGFFNSIFLLNKSEKTKVLNLVFKKNVQSFLFYTDYRNIPHILNYGIQQLKNIQLKGKETYYVWSYLQHDESVELEFDVSTRAYFWKWAGESQMNPENMCVIGIDPIRLSKQTVNDWVYDTSQKTIAVHETIPRESISWILLRHDAPIPRLEQYIKLQDLGIKIFYGHNSEITSKEKQ